MRHLALILIILMRLTSADAFDLEGHRGARGLAPENTLPAFATALQIGVTTLELDVGVTKDGVVVVSHDRALNPGHTRGPDGEFLNGPGPLIHDLTLAELKTYDVGRLKPGTAYAAAFPQQRPVDGARIPALSEVFALAQQAGATAVRFNIETKLTPTSAAETPDPDAFAQALVRVVREAKMADRVIIQSFDWPASRSRRPRKTPLVGRAPDRLPGRPGSIFTTSTARYRGWSRQPAARSGRPTIAT
jgi:glycerophosphoryl diester phosphodiesterase